MKKRTIAKRADVAPTGMLDAYTEGPANSAMSDSAKFKEGYKKKGKGKQKNIPKKVETEDDQETKEEPEEKESWEDDVVESWDQLEVEQMPVPQKVKQEMRREEKKRKKEQEKSKALSEKNAETSRKSESENIKSAEPEPVREKTPVPVPTVTNVEPKYKDGQSDDIVKAVNQLTLGDSKPSSDQKELTPEEQAAIKAEREAKKAAKAAQKAAAKDKGKQPVNEEKSEVQEPVDGKSKEQLKAERKAQYEQKVKSEDGGEPKPEKSKAELKAERRAKQEAQRLAKSQAQQSQEQKQKPESKIRVPDEIKADDKKTEKKLMKKLTSQNVPARTKAQRQVGLFSHLHQYERELSVTRDLPVVGGNLHPAIVQLGIQYAEGKIVGSSGRCISLLLALKTLLLDTLPQLSTAGELYKEVDNVMKPNITFLKQCRPLSISMSNAIRYLKREVMNLERGLSQEEIRTNIEETVDDFINVNFTLHPKAISETANKKIRDGDIILTFSHSMLVEKVLLDAAAQGKKIKVIVADGRVQNLGRALCPALVSAGIHSTYILLSAVPQVLPSVTKVLLGCEGVMANGCVLATVGTSQVALLAKSCNKPVVVCCETYKFTERVQTDSFVYNELSDPDDLVQTGRQAQHLADWRDLSSLCLLNLMYDLTPTSLVDSIITEISEIPPTSVPVVLRLHNMGEHMTPPV